MKLLLCFAVTVLGASSTGGEHLFRRDADDISIEELMQEEENIQKWGSTGGGSTGVAAGGSDKCRTPSITGGFWKCEVKEVRVPVSNQEKRHKRDAAEGRWSKPQPTVPTIGVLRTVCHLSCETSRYKLIGHPVATCDPRTGKWIKPASAYCEALNLKPKPPKTCSDLRATNGVFKCTGSPSARQCTLQCSHGSKSTNGRYHFNCHYGHWDGRADCTAASKCQVPPRKATDKGYWHCQPGPCQPVTSSWGRKKRSDDGEDLGRWGAPAPQCLICHFKCDPIHKLKGGGKAQCRMSDGVWIEKSHPVCHMGHMCEWPTAGPMGCYECKDNLMQLGYQGLGFNTEGEEEEDRREINFEDMEEIDEEDEDYDSFFRKKRDADKKAAKKAKKAAKQNESDGIARWSPPPPPTYPPPTWWNAFWECKIHCAKYHYPRSGSYVAKCKLDSSTWSIPPTECVYRTPCKDPSTSYGSFQCWETTILPDKDDEGPPEEEEEDDDKPPSKDGSKDSSKKKKKKGKGRRSASNSTEPVSADEFLYRGDEVDEYFSPNPIGRWGPPSKPPKPDQRYWDFDVRKECVLTCNDCYDPTNKKSICINGEWQEGFKPGKCEAWNKCPDKPWWPIGNGYWSCTGGAGRVRTCGLQCYDHHIVQPIIPRLPQPEDPHKVGCDNKYVTIENGWMECHTNNSPVDCMIMCNKGYTPNSSQAGATCSNGEFLPAQSGSNSWACVPGDCDKGQWGEVCWTKASMGRKKRAIEADEAARNRRDSDEDEAGLGRWGMAVTPTSRCDNCDGLWKNQIHCVFDTKCTDVPPHVPGGSARCERVMEGKQDYHRCEVQCPKNHVAVCNGNAGRKRREDEDIGRWGNTPVTTPATVTKVPVTHQVMTCDAKTGNWNQRCTCEWNLECAVPQRPNANYECNWVNGIFVCELQCKGKGEYVPARWHDVFEFRCKRGVWIEKTPQGCVYEPPCVKPDVENGKLKNCRRETCHAPEDVVMELMPGQANHNYINEDVITGGHIGYTGRKRREDSYEEETVDAEFTADGKFYNDDGSYTEFTYDSNGLPVTQAADDTEQVITDDEEEQGGLASEGSIGRWSFNSFGRCPVRRSVAGGQLHCHSIGGIIGKGNHPIGMPPPMSHHNQCMEKNPINGGWMECKPNGGICMIMCNPGMVPLTANLFSNCNGRQWNPSQWGCRPGHCNHHIYKEACYDHPNNHGHGKKRRSADNDTLSFEEGDEEEQRGLFDRWIAPPPPPPPPPVHYVLCSVSCAHYHRHAGAVNYKCDPRDGSFAPALKGCYNVKPRPPVVKTKKTSCLCCDVKCNEWYQGGGTAKCAKGYWFQVDKCDKYGMCGKPANPANGEYTCLYEHEYGYMSRKRRSDDDEPDYDREAPDEDRSESMGWSSAKDFKQYVKNLQDTNEGGSMEVGGYRWEQVKQKKMICNLACAPGYVAVAPQAVCIDGTWVVKPSYCKPQHKCSAPPSNSNGVWECRVEKWPVGTTPGMPGQCQEKNPITNGWMECKPNGGMCMIMCNNGYVPLTTNLMTGCNGAQWNPSLWGCKPGYCDNAVYKEACWNHPNNNFGRKRREAETPAPQPIFSKYVKVTDHFDIDDFPEMQDYSSAGTDRWEQMQMKSFLVCKLRCQGGTFQSGSTVAKCDLDTGFWHPSPGQCKPWVGGSKCAAPSAESGTYNCYSVTGSAHGRKRRDTELSEFEDIWQNRPNGGVLGRWGQSYMVCDLTCSPTMVPENGKYVAKCDQTSGNWIAPPTNCIETNYTPKCLQKLVNGGVINCEARERGKTRYDCDLNCYNGFEPIDPNRVSYTCNDKSGAYVPQPLGCKTKTIPPAPAGCVKPTNTANGSWKCHKQDFDQPYPPQSRTLNWDSLPDLPRAKRDSDEEGWVDEEIIYDNTNEDEADGNSIGRWASDGKKPKNFICQVKCDKGYQMSGNYLAVCRVDSNQWIMPPVAFCNEHPKKPGLCKVPTIKDGSYDCKEVKEKNNNSNISPLFECTLTCKNGYRPGHGRWTATCDQNTGLWQIPPANCIKDVRKCENVPSVQNGFMSCTSQNRNEEFDGAGPTPKPAWDPLLNIQFTTNANLAVQSTRATTTRAPATTRAPTTKASRSEEEEQKTKPATAEEMIGATGECALEPAVNEVKGGGLHCRKDRAGNTLCMIKCDEGFRPWHSNLVILCRNGVYYNRNNPTEVQKNMKCKEAPCDVERFGVACYDHPANRERREAEFEAALNEEPAVVAARWHQPAPPLKTCQVQCNTGYQNTGSPVAECDLNTGEWRTMPGQCEPVPDNTLGCAAPDDVAYGEWKCWVSNDSDDMRGASNTLPPEGSQQREDGKKKKKKQKQKAKDRGLFEFIPTSGMSKDEFEDYVDRTYGFDAVRRRRSANDAWSDAIGRWGTQYFICQLECDPGYELKDINYNKVGCRMSDHHWLKPYIQKKHYCKPIGSKNSPNRQTTNGPCDKPELVPNVKNGAYEVCESTKAKKRCDLKCDAGYAAVGSQKWVCKNGKDGAEITDEGGQCKKAPELPSPPGSCKPPSTWKETGSYSAGTHDAACDGDANGKKCFITYSLECKPGYKPFGPADAVCRPKKSFWEVMPTHCLPVGFEPPKKWNMDTANLDAYFMRTEEWDAMTAEDEGPKWEIVEDVDADKTEDLDEAYTTEAPATEAPATKAEKPKENDSGKDNDIPVGYGQCVGLPPVPNYDQGKEKVSNKKVGWECSNTNEYLDGTVCKPICGPGSMPTGINNVCTCDKKGRCKWKGFIKDHCQRMMCPPLPTPVNADYIKTPKKVSKKIQRMGGVMPAAPSGEGGLLAARWGSQYKQCPLGVSIPKSKVMCTLRCQPGLIVKGARKATTAKAACKCDEQGNCKWVMKSNECVAP